jgi:SAM-dependent methyltransferase
MPIALIHAGLRSGADVPDVLFDSMYSAKWRRASPQFWSPVCVAQVAARWLTEGGATRILDVGCGPGKLCVIGALTTPASFVGVEQRGELVAEAREAARRLGVAHRVAIVHGVIQDLSFSDFEALYFYNPLGENLHGTEECLDRTVELGARRFQRDMNTVEAELDRLPIDARLVTYHGLGGRIPDSFSLERIEPAGTDVLRLWIKRRAEKTGYHVESYHGARSVRTAASA